MQNLRKKTVKNGEAAVSPVVGVMLMLVVTIIIAAVVSGFAGNTVSGKDKAPSANVEFHIRNGGDNATSYFTMKVLGVSEPIATKNLRLITSWTTTGKNATSLDYGNATIGGSTSYSGKANVKVTGETSAYTGNNLTVPTGYGNGVTEWANDTYHPQGAQWGYFSLSAGTTTFDKPGDYGLTGCGSGSVCSNYNYSDNHEGVDAMESILGRNWTYLRQGDSVNVRILDAQSGKMIVDQNVVVER